MSELWRIFHLRPAYDCIGVQPCVHGSESCKPGTGGSHGRHNAEMHLTVRGPDAEISLVVGTGWDLPTVPAHHRLSRDGDWPQGRFIEIHTARPRYDGQDGGPPRPDGTCKDWSGCYLDAGYSMSDEPTRLLVEKGSDAAWEWLEALYYETQAEMSAVETKPAEEKSFRPELGELEATKLLLEATREQLSRTIADFCAVRDALPREQVERILAAVEDQP